MRRHSSSRAAVLFASIGAIFLSLLAIRGMATQPIPDSPVANPASASPTLKYLPKDYWFAGEIDWKKIAALMNSDQVKSNPQFAQFQQAMQMITLMTGIDAQKDIERVTLFAVGTSRENSAVLAAIQGSFDNSAVTAALDRQSSTVTRSDYNKATIYSASGGSIWFPEKSTIVIGTDKLVRDAIDQQAQANPQLPTGLRNVLDRTSADGLLWFAVRPKPILDSSLLSDWRNSSADLTTQLANIDCMAITGNLTTDGFSFDALGYATTPDQAKAVGQFLTDRKNQVLQKDGTNVVFATLLVLSKIDTSGPYVQGSLQITAPALTELWNTKVTVKQ